MERQSSAISVETETIGGKLPRQNPLIGLFADGEQALLVQQGVLAALADTGFATVLLPNGAADQALFVATHRPHGMLKAGPLLEDPAMPASVQQAAIRTVRIAPDACADPAGLVCSNDRQGAHDAVQYLFALGHRRIGFVAGPEHCRSARERELGYLDALAEHGLDLGAELAAQGDGTVASGRAAGHLLLEVSPRPTAILASSDEMAAGVVQAAHKAGVDVPIALSVMGFGDAALAEACVPPLTTMRLPWAEMAFTAAIKLIDPARADAQPVEFFCELVRRGSTGPVPG